MTIENVSADLYLLYKYAPTSVLLFFHRYTKITAIAYISYEQIAPWLFLTNIPSLLFCLICLVLLPFARWLFFVCSFFLRLALGFYVFVLRISTPSRLSLIYATSFLFKPFFHFIFFCHFTILNLFLPFLLFKVELNWLSDVLSYTFVFVRLLSSFKTHLYSNHTFLP